MPMTIRPPVKRVERVRAAGAAASARVEVVRLRVEVLDLLGHDPRAGGEDELVVAEPLPVGERRPSDVASSIRIDLADDELDAAVEQRALRPLEPFGALAAHGDVHEARLVDVAARLVDDGDLDARRRRSGDAACARARLATSVPPTPPPRMTIRVPSRRLSGASRRRSRRSRRAASTPTRRWPAFSTHLGMSMREPRSDERTADDVADRLTRGWRG